MYKVSCINCKYNEENKKNLRKEILSTIKKGINSKTNNEKIEDFFIPQVLNIIEIDSCFNCQCSKHDSIDELANELAFNYTVSGARMLRDEKLPLILKEVKSPLNIYYAEERATKKDFKATLWECFEHYVLNGGLDDFYKNHEEFVSTF